jgi:hypothetical protein
MTSNFLDHLYVMRLDVGDNSNSASLHGTIHNWFNENDVGSWFMSTLSKLTNTPNYSRHRAYELEVSVYYEEEALKFMLAFGAKLHRTPL